MARPGRREVAQVSSAQRVRDVRHAREPSRWAHMSRICVVIRLLLGVFGVDELDLRHRFQPERSDLNQRCYDVAMLINRLVPDGREKSLAVTALEECVLWVDASDVRNGGSR